MKTNTLNKYLCALTFSIFTFISLNNANASLEEILGGQQIQQPDGIAFLYKKKPNGDYYLDTPLRLQTTFQHSSRNQLITFTLGAEPFYSSQDPQEGEGHKGRKRNQKSNAREKDFTKRVKASNPRLATITDQDTLDSFIEAFFDHWALEAYGIKESKTTQEDIVYATLHSLLANKPKLWSEALSELKNSYPDKKDTEDPVKEYTEQGLGGCLHHTFRKGIEEAELRAQYKGMLSGEVRPFLEEFNTPGFVAIVSLSIAVADFPEPQGKAICKRLPETLSELQNILSEGFSSHLNVRMEEIENENNSGMHM